MRDQRKGRHDNHRLLIRFPTVSSAVTRAQQPPPLTCAPSLLLTKEEAGLVFPWFVQLAAGAGKDGEKKEMKEQQKGGGSKLGRWLGAPVRALSRACDSYVRRMSACAGMMPTHAGAVGGRGGFAPGMQAAATFSSRSRRSGAGGDDDVDALVRAMSQRQASARRAAGGGDGVAAAVPARSRSVAVGRIDEDAPCEFGADDDVRVGGPPVRRARSVAVGSAGLAARAAGGGFGAAKKSAVRG